MKISEIIQKNYEELLDRCRKYNSAEEIRCPEDVLHDILLTAITKYKDKEVDEEEVIHYLKRSLYFDSLHYFSRDKIHYVPLEGDYPDSDSGEN